MRATVTILRRCLVVTHMVKLRGHLARGELPQPSRTATRISRGFLYSASRVCLPGHPSEQASVALQVDPLQCNGGWTSYDVRYDVEFVLLAAWRATGGYVTGRLKRLAETCFETQLATIARVWEPTNWPQIGNQTSPSWLFRLRSGLSQATNAYTVQHVRLQACIRLEPAKP
jgi:hypothetical protein